MSPSEFELSELDLGFFEKSRQAASDDNAGAGKQIEISPESVDRIRVIFLGASAVGKTSIIQQFVWNDFNDAYEPTDKKYTYYPSVIMNDRRYEMKITDLPAIPYFPVDSLYECAEYRFYGLMDASAYVLVFDLSNPETFQYIKNIREQILEAGNASRVPLLVVGNKEDFVAKTGGQRMEIGNLVKEEWRCDYVECSARRHNSVIAVFKRLIASIDNVSAEETAIQSPPTDDVREVLNKNRCVVV